jgi:hypothetical protein
MLLSPAFNVPRVETCAVTALTLTRRTTHSTFSASPTYTSPLFFPISSWGLSDAMGSVQNLSHFGRWPALG